VASHVVPALNRSELLTRLEAVFYPARSQMRLTESQIETMLLELCVNCPDLAGAMEVVLEAPQGVTSEEVLDQVLRMPPRSPAAYSEDELALNHPLRHWRLQLRAA
jgi:hypothetical protein